MAFSIVGPILGRGIFRVALDKLLGGPGEGWVIGNVEMEAFSTVVSQD
jgi:hypothetical protein